MKSITEIIEEKTKGKGIIILDDLIEGANTQSKRTTYGMILRKKGWVHQKYGLQQKVYYINYNRDITIKEEEIAFKRLATMEKKETINSLLNKRKERQV